VSGEYEIWPSMQSFTDVVNITDRIKLKRGLSRSTRRIARGTSGRMRSVLNRYRKFCDTRGYDGYTEVFNAVPACALRKESPV
jgi:hypothetical protein